ncbi:MAG: hypothetical protein EOP90_03410 [Lysobacteraceae bacterium]|nr:MAG: hypothetical protein EOP90_03410 [Xanthomonadaceae bacterium]
MRTPLSLSAVLFASGSLLAAGAAFAGTPDAADGSRHQRRAAMQQQIFERLDADHDGEVSRAEYKAWVDGRFDKLDVNGDGSVDADEVARSPATAERVNKRAEGFVRRYDSSGSGKVTRSDFEAKEMARFERIGAGAASVTKEQFAKSRPSRLRGAAEAPSID